ncbi:MAG TPA: alanine--tRNA ligase, partial [Acidimicrobiales bacterium]|nr:alanine--tRNA ligase [Acidimicrobiales bacterium]
MDANELRAAFTQFFVERGHVAVPSASLIPHDPTLLFTVAGMVPFKSYFTGDEVPPYSRAVTVQKCMRAGGKQSDLELVGRTTRHLSFLEMLGNFSFGDYFKADAIPWSWAFVTEVLGLDPDRLWVTVHDSDDEAVEVWTTEVGFPPERIQRMGEDNFWRMGDTGPCGPCSELHYDKGEAYGAPGGPAEGSGERYVEIWNLVFTQYDQQPDGSLVELPKKNIDTGAGLERILSILQGTDSVFGTDVLAPIVAAAEAATGLRSGVDEATDIGLRIMADHGRAMSFLVGDGVLPSNEGRGYVLRRIIRRAVRHAYQLGVTTAVTPPLAGAVAEVMATAYPDLAAQVSFIEGILGREEERFRHTLKAGSAILDEELARGAGRIEGEVAFRLHDTYGFPIDLTREIAAERGVEVDLAGFEESMAEQRSRARAAGLGGEEESEHLPRYRELVEQVGTTTFLGYDAYDATARVLLVIDDGYATGEDGGPAGPRVEVFLDRTPFYAEGGGQVGDTGVIATETGRVAVVDTTAALPELVRHHGVVVEGTLQPGQQATAQVDVARREAIRRNHTGTHLLHWALREVLGPHVKQQGSLVAPDRLRFDFSHFSPVGPEELARIEDLVNTTVVANDAVHTEVMSREQADATGAIAFFGERYGDQVRVVHAGDGSVELCGGTHVDTLGAVGPLQILSEGSIGANTRRIEALTGQPALAHLRRREGVLARAAELLRAPTTEEVPDRIERLTAQVRAVSEEVKALRAQAIHQEATELGEQASDGVVVVRRDDLPRNELRDLAVAVRDQPGVTAVVLIGSPDGQGVALVAA